MMLKNHPITIPSPSTSPTVGTTCFHCGLPCPDDTIRSSGRMFCCAGCRAVHDLLAGAGLVRYYALEQTPGLRPRPDQPAGHFAALRDPAIRQALLDYEDDRRARVTFHIPAIHCAACVWLLENLHRIAEGVGAVTVCFPTRRVTVDFDPRRLGLDRLAEILAGLGYEPRLGLDQVANPERPRVNRALWMRLGVAGFAAGNIMMLSFAFYLGLGEQEPGLRALFGWISAALALPVLLYAASGYFASAWNGLRLRAPGIDLPIAVGLLALFGQSLWEVASGHGEGYFDSFAGLVFLLLAGRAFQDRTHAALSFERDYTAYFPLSVTRELECETPVEQALDANVSRAFAAPKRLRPRRRGRPTSREEIVPITRLRVGDRVVVRDRELVPADADLEEGRACIDYSFVTGEAEPVERGVGERIHAGGRQVGGPIRLRVRKEVSQGYLTSLWNREAFRKPEDRSLSVSVDRISRWFAPAILLIALALGLGWFARTDLETAVRVFASTLIIACPCALAMAAPYTFGAALRVLGRHGFHLRNARVVESLARIDAVALDKTGTLTRPDGGAVVYAGRPLTAAERSAVAVVASASTHPLSRRLARGWGGAGAPSPDRFVETPGQGVEGECGGMQVRLGRASFAGGADGTVEPPPAPGAARAHLALNGVHAGRIDFPSTRRPGLAPLLAGLRKLGAELALLSGDDPRMEPEWREVFGPAVRLRFGLDPHQKLECVRAWQAGGRAVLMAGDGLNDAGALRQAEVGVAVTEDVTAFSPACDGLLEAGRLVELPRFLRFARASATVLRVCFAVSFLYNAGGLALAARGLVTPLWSAILMPLSSFSAMLIAVLGVRLAAWRLGLSAPAPQPSPSNPLPAPAPAPA